MPINWHDKAVQDRLLTAVIASVDNKISIAEIARLFGRDMTYHAVENYLRKFRKEAKDMKGGTAGRDIVAPSTPRLKKKAKDVSPTKSVRTGRVTKKKALAVKVKPEPVDDAGTDDDDTSGHNQPFEFGGLEDAVAAESGEEEV